MVVKAAKRSRCADRCVYGQRSSKGLILQPHCDRCQRYCSATEAAVAEDPAYNFQALEFPPYIINDECIGGSSWPCSAIKGCQ